MRLDKYLAHCGFGTRKEVKNYIKKGFVTVNGVVQKKDSTHIDENNDVVEIDGMETYYQKYVYLMLNKPAGYISATEDKVHTTVLDLIDGYEQYELFPVGRLDIDTVGLLLLTNDGELAHHILAPKKHISKLYYAKIRGEVTANDIEIFAKGIVFNDFISKPANLKILSVSDGYSEIEVEIFEGKFHQVKRMFESVGKEVIYLKRIKMKNLWLDDSLLEGEYRELTNEELEDLQKKIENE